MIIRGSVGSVDSACVKWYVDDTTSVCGQGFGSESGVESDDCVIICQNVLIIVVDHLLISLFDSLVAGVSF